ncbi:MAG: macro domain-containing protein, partial [Actinomycetaceae bacterium]|nr:macro domain-containing protein [Actinomycetaceae bacterium]
PALPELTGCPIPLHNCLDWHLHAQAGPWMRNDAAKIIELQGFKEKPGHAKITRGYRLPARFVIHTVGPDVTDGAVSDNARKELRNCYMSSLDLAHEQGTIRSIAFPAISTGINGFPPEEAAQIALTAISDWTLAHHDSLIDLILISVRFDEDAEVYTKALSEWVW